MNITNNTTAHGSNTSLNVQLKIALLLYGIVLVQFSHTYCFAPETFTVTFPLFVALLAAVTVKVFWSAEDATINATFREVFEP